MYDQEMGRWCGGASSDAGGAAARATLTALSLATSAAPGRVRQPRSASLALAASALCRPIDVTLTRLKFHIVFVL